MTINQAICTSFALLMVFGGQARAADPKPIAVSKLNRSTQVDFEKEVLPLLNHSCLACHNKTKPKAGLVLESPADIRKGGDTGPAVVAGKPEQSLLIKSAAHSDPNIEIMPPAGNKVNAPNLSGDELGLISLWISQGATGEVKGPAPLVWQKPADRVQAIFAVAISPNGSVAAAGRGTGIDLYDLKASKLLIRLSDPSLEKGSVSSAGLNAAHRDLVQSLAFSADGQTIASGAFREVKLWQKDGDGVWKLDRVIGTGGNDSPLVDRVYAIDFSSDGELLAVGGGVPSRSGQIVLYSLKEGKIVRSLDEIHSDSVLSLQFSADGKRLVTGSADKFVRLINVADGKVVKGFEGHTHHILGVAIRKDGKSIASAGADNKLNFWDAETGERRKQAATFEKEVTAVRYVGDGDTVVACSGDGKVKLIKDGAADGKVLPGPTDFMYAVAASADGKTIVGGGQDGVLRVWSMEGKAAAAVTFGPDAASK